MSNINHVNFEDENTLIIMDTNVWLDLYRLPAGVIIALITAMIEHQEKFWLPHQVYTEFNRHVKKSRTEALDRYKKIKKITCEQLNNTSGKVNQEFENLKRNSLFEATKLQENFKNQMKEILDKVKAELDELDSTYQREMACISENDRIQEFIEGLYKTSLSNSFSINELIKIYEEGEIRYKYKVSPGYTDVKKLEWEAENDFLLRKYGDLIIWKEILRYVQGTAKNVIFVQNEKKSDWWQSPDSKTIARVLIEEYQEATYGKGAIEMLDFEQLLKMHGNCLGLPANTVQDIVDRFKLESELCKYINRNKENLLKEYLMNIYEKGEKGYELFEGVSLYGGYVESVEDFEIDEIFVEEIEFEYDNKEETNYVVAEVVINGTANIIEYINKDVYHSGNICFKVNSKAEMGVSFDFSNLQASVEESYTITECNVYDEVLIDVIKCGEFSIDVVFDEDMFRDR